MITWLLNRIFRSIDMNDVPDLSPKEKMLALKDAYQAEGFVNYKKRRMAAMMKTLALKADDPLTVAFYRGCLYIDQMDIQNMQKSHAQFVKERGEINPVMDQLRKELTK